MIEHIFECAVY